MADVPLAKDRRAASLSIVLPCYNEQDNVEQCVREAVFHGRRCCRCLEVLVVDDGSTDETAERVCALRAELPEVRLIQHGRNRGYGAALRSGFEAAAHELVFYTDADLQFELSELPKLVALSRQADVVCGYRQVRADGLGRRLLGTLWTATVNALMGLRMRDVNCAFKLFPRRLFERVRLDSGGATIDAEVMLKAQQLGMTVCEVPVRHRRRVAGLQSGASGRVIARALRELFHVLALRRWGVRQGAFARPDDAG